MTNLEFCLARRKAESPTFLRVLKALPPARLDYRPEPKGRTAAELGWVIAAEEAALARLLETGVVNWKDEKPPATLDEIVATYEKGAAAVDAAIGRIGEAGWEKKGKFLMGDGPAWEDTFGQFVWGFLFDQIHHRGQLTTYLRPMGGKVPSIYGPSADDPGQ
jgi:uncharacterized damage-inducible protein DinB